MPQPIKVNGVTNINKTQEYFHYIKQTGIPVEYHEKVRVGY